MIVSEFIELLKSFNPDAEISRDDSETILLSFISEGGASMKTTKYVFIEKADYVEEDC